jgi:hypothetical protein
MSTLAIFRPRRMVMFRDMAESSPIPARVFQRHQPQIARDLLATLKPIRSLDDQHERQCRQRPYSGMGHQALGRRTLLHFLLDRLTQCGDGRVQSIQQLQHILPSPAGPRPTSLYIRSSALWSLFCFIRVNL